MTTMNTDWDNMMDILKQQSAPKKTYPGEAWKEKLFKYKLKSDGTWEGLIRFLPRPKGDGDGNPSMKVISHAFNDVGGWFIDNCPHTYGEPCPACEYNAPIYKAGGRPKGTERKTSYYSNILVLKDPQNPENEGKVFIFKYGKGIAEQINAKCFPENPDIDGEGINVFHPKNGTNFKLKIKKIKTVDDKTGKTMEYPDYKASAFNESIVALDDATIESAIPQLHKLSEICDPTTIKSYEKLKERFDKVMGNSMGVAGTGYTAPSNSAVTSDDLPSYSTSGKSAVIDDGSEEDDFLRELAGEMD